MNKFKNGVAGNGGEFIPIETNEEREYLQDLYESWMNDLEWETWAIQNGYSEDDENDEEESE